MEAFNFDVNAEQLSGTTVMAAVYDGGVVIGADSRTTSGNYIGNRATDKVTPLAENIYICRSGAKADTQTISDHVRNYLAQQSIEFDTLPEVRSAANIAMQIMYNNKNALSAALIVAGWDEKSGPSVFCLPQGGTLLKLPFTVGGSGSVYIAGWCDKNWKNNMTREECEAFVRKAVSLAMARDASSGGMIRTVTVTSTGAHRHLTRGHEVPVGQGEIQAGSQAPVAVA
eukprot:CAMPEP_0196583960 /NCGR_PEP_ID=MMETSP1081-20130531/45329_1 /TAXON_ID=36882 /ORGANISM="Pyramimonas amylifera, Strain CCMP720" /LENGTH=227 /DNA_ID=CAMNT_0041905007 /DNA_START=77 /DNA_END=760 /DNA_ORIENTATION=-